MTSPQAMVGHAYPAASFVLTPEAARAYAAATDDATAYPPDEGPPMAVTMATIVHGAAQVVADERVIGDPMRLLRLLHSAEELTWHRPLPLGVPWRVQPTLRAIDTNSIGEVLVVHTAVTDAAGEPLADVHTSLLIRESRGVRRRREDLPLPVAVERPAWEASWQVAEDQAQRYAAASGDRNPIHTDDAIARQAGLRGCILHGLCTMAFARRAVAAHAAQAGRAQVRRLRVRFSKPVYMGDALRCVGGVTQADGTVPFAMLNQDGHHVLTEGTASLDAR